jgi:hypothetical protein
MRNLQGEKVMGRQSKVTLDAAIRSLQELRENRARLLKLRKHLLIGVKHINILLNEPSNIEVRK